MGQKRITIGLDSLSVKFYAHILNWISINVWFVNDSALMSNEIKNKQVKRIKFYLLFEFKLRHNIPQNSFFVSCGV